MESSLIKKLTTFYGPLMTSYHLLNMNLPPFRYIHLKKTPRSYSYFVIFKDKVNKFEVLMKLISCTNFVLLLSLFFVFHCTSFDLVGRKRPPYKNYGKNNMTPDMKEKSVASIWVLRSINEQNLSKVYFESN